MKAVVQRVANIAVRNFSEQNAVAKIIADRQVQLGIIDPVVKNGESKLLEIIADRQRVLVAERQQAQSLYKIVKIFTKEANITTLTPEEKTLHDTIKEIGIAEQKKSENSTKYSVNDCLATRRVQLGLADFDSLTPNQQEAWHQYGSKNPATIVGAAQDNGPVNAQSQAIQK